MPFDVRTVFRTLSDSIRAEFERSAQIPHPTGKGSTREEIVRKLLREYLPSKYSVGQGQIIVATNHISQQMDVVIHDQTECPRLLPSPEHSIFPLEAVYGVVSVKSALSSKDLQDAFENVVSAKSLVPNRTIVIKRQMMQMGLASPSPVGIVFAFEAERSLEAIAKQARELQAALPDPRHAPDLIVVLGKGLVGPRDRVRDEINQVKLPPQDKRMVVREVREHTLLRFYLQLTNELNTITLPPLNLDEYLQMPEVIDGHRVSGHGPFFLSPLKLPLSGPPVLKKLSRSFILKVIRAIEGVAPVGYEEHLQHSLGAVALQGLSAQQLKSKIVEYNPLNHPPMTESGMDFKTGVSARPYFAPLYVTIDGQHVAIDGNAVGLDDWETSDVAFDEIFDPGPLQGKSSE